MTKKEMFNAILAIDAVSANAEMVEFLNHQIDLLDSRNVAKKPTKTQLENVSIKNTICEVLADADAPMRVKDMIVDSRLENYTTSNISALLRQLLPETGDGRVVRTIEKKVAYFALA